MNIIRKISELRTVMFVSLGLVAAIGSSAHSAQEVEDMPASDFIQQFEDALATQSWSEVAPLIHPRASVTFSNGTVHKGKEAVKRAYEGNFARIKHEKYEMTNIHWLHNSAESAVYLFDFYWTGTMEGESVSGGGRGTGVLLFEDGRWLLLTEHLGYPEH